MLQKAVNKGSFRWATSAGSLLLFIGCTNFDADADSGRSAYPSAWESDSSVVQQNCDHISGIYSNAGDSDEIKPYNTATTIAGSVLVVSTKFGVPEIVRFSYEASHERLRAEFLGRTAGELRVTDYFVLPRVACNLGRLEWRDEVAGGSDGTFVRTIRNVSITTTENYLVVYSDVKTTTSTLFVFRSKSEGRGWHRFAKAESEIRAPTQRVPQ